MPVDRVVRGHDRIRSAFLHGDFKALQVNFPQRALGYDRIDLTPVLLLVVAGKMLQRRVGAALENSPVCMLRRTLR